MIKIEVREGEKRVYPCLMESSTNGAIILFRSVKEGTVIHPGSSIHEIGEWGDDWVLSNFKVTNKIVELSNG